MNKTLLNTHLVGIDLGTTKCAVAIVDEHGQPKVIPDPAGEAKTPSVVSIGNAPEEDLVGTAAHNNQLLAPDRTFLEFKRDVGTDKVYVTVAGREITPAFLQMLQLRWLRKGLIDYFNDPEAGSKAVITVPAYFKEKQRQSVVNSAREAGIEAVKIINEPTAASIAYGVSQIQGDRLVQVLDLGGGTFDASLLKMEGPRMEVLATRGDPHLGGVDVDNLLMELLVAAFQKEHGIMFSPETHPADWFQAREDVIRQKHLLASRREVTLAARVEGHQVQVLVTRERFKELIEPLLARIGTCVTQLLEEAQVDANDVTQVLLVGGSSRLLPLQERMRQRFGEDAIVKAPISPDLAIAEGAAIEAARLAFRQGATLVSESTHEAIPAPPITHTDVMPHSLGVAVHDRAGDGCVCSVILAKNQPLPCRATKDYGSVTDTQTRFQVKVLQGEDHQPVAECLVVGEEALELPPRSPDQPSLEASMGYDESGMVQVKVVDKVSGTEKDITLDFFATK